MGDKNDFLPKKIHARTRMNDKQGFDILFSKNPFIHERGDPFSTCGVYYLKEVYVIGTGFKLNMPEYFHIREEGGLYRGPKRRSTDRY